MAWILSTGAKNALLQTASTAQKSTTATTYSFGDGTGTGSCDQILDSGNGLVDYDDYEGYTVSVIGSTSNDGDYVILRAAAGYIEVPAGSLVTEPAGDQVILVVSKGGSFAEVFRHCVMDLYSGTRPTSADSVESGTKLVRLTRNGGAFVPGSPDNGLNFGTAASGTIELADDPDTGTTMLVSGEGLVTAAAQMAVLYANDVSTGASTTAVRLYGQVATSGAEVNMSAGTTVTDGVDVVPTSFSFSL